MFGDDDIFADIKIKPKEKKTTRPSTKKGGVSGSRAKKAAASFDDDMGE